MTQMKTRSTWLSAAACCLAVACSTESATPPDAMPVLAPELGTGDRTPSSVTLVEIAGAGDLAQPRDLAFNPLRPAELWVVTHDNDAAAIIHDAPEPTRRLELRQDGYAQHFMPEPSAIAFGADATTIGKPGTFATCGESRNTYNGQAEANDFMGPALWSSDLSVFAQHDPNGLGSHLDMLHCSPLCMGLAHEADNIYWAFGGTWNGIVKYDFESDDGIGNDNHGDGTAFVYARGELFYVAGVPSHLTYDAVDRMLYIADTGHRRVVRLDTQSGTVGAQLEPFEPMGAYHRIDDAVLSEVVPASAGLDTPSGLELRNDILYVSDYATGWISAFSRTGELLNQLDTGLGRGALAGMAFGPDGKLYFVDMAGDRVFRIDP
ncbi:MAG: hypothetical protein EXR73_04940 [Myxococcales bacterium]|nr:hypothetical protein [Myxococcales bacterium]